MKKILILDIKDEPDCFLGKPLRLAGFQVLRANSGEDAVNCIIQRKQTEKPFDLLLISRTPQDFPLSRIIAQIWGAGATLPILVVSRPETAEHDLSAISGIQTCRSSEVLMMMSELFGVQPHRRMEIAQRT